MHTVLQRGNSVVAYALTVLTFVTFACFLSTVFLNYSTNVKISTSGEVVRSVADFSASQEKLDLGFLRMDLQVDVTNLFNWNVKQLFLYLTAEYKTPNNRLNQVVLWDKIILRGEPAVLDMANISPKYYFWDDGTGLRSNPNVTLTLSWNIIPNAGLLPNVLANGHSSFRFPSKYIA